jgi:hypothetical protein
MHVFWWFAKGPLLLKGPALQRSQQSSFILYVLSILNIQFERKLIGVKDIHIFDKNFYELEIDLKMKTT